MFLPAYRLWPAVLLLAGGAAQAQITVTPSHVELNAGDSLTFQAEAKQAEAGDWLWEVLGHSERLIDPVTGRFTAPRVTVPTALMVTVRLRSNPAITGFATIRLAPGAVERVESKADPAGLRELLHDLPPALNRLTLGYLGAEQVRLLRGGLPFDLDPDDDASQAVFGDPARTGVSSSADLVWDHSLGCKMLRINGLERDRTPVVGYGCPTEFEWLRAAKDEVRDGQLLTWTAPYLGEDRLQRRSVEAKADRLTLAFTEQVTHASLQSLARTDEGWGFRNFGTGLIVRGMLPFAGDPLAAPDLHDGIGSSARFRAAGGLFAFERPNRWDPENRHWNLRKAALTDPAAHVVRVAYQDAKVVTRWGRDGEPGFQDGPGTVARFNRPTFLTGAVHGVVTLLGPAAPEFWVADSGNHSVRGVTVAGEVTTLAGCGRAGHRDGAAAEAEFRHPLGIAQGPDGALYVADAGNQVIRRIKDGQVETIAGAVNQAGTDDGPGPEARFTALKGLAVDPVRDLIYVVDGHAIRRIHLDGHGRFQVWTVLGAVTEPGFEARLQERKDMLIPCLRDPWAIVWSAGSLYISDRGNHCLRRFLLETEQEPPALWSLAGHPSQPELHYGLLQHQVEEAKAELGYATLAGPAGIAMASAYEIDNPMAADRRQLIVSSGTCLAMLHGLFAGSDDPSIELFQGGTQLLAPKEAAVDEPVSVRLQRPLNEDGTPLLPEGLPDRDRDFLYTLDFIEADGSLAERVKGEALFETLPVVSGRFRQPGQAQVRMHLVTLEGNTMELRQTISVR